MTEQPPNPIQPTESTLVLGFLREDIQDLRRDIRQDIRQIHEHIGQTNGRIEVVSQFEMGSSR